MWTKREKELWEIVEPYAIPGGKLRPDAPPEVIAAAEELHEINWGPDASQ